MASLGNWPSSIVPKSVRMQLQTNQRANAGPGGGSEQVIDMLNDRWMAYVTLPVRKFAEAAAVEAFLASFRGQVNTVNLWHFARSAPRGTMRGTPTMFANASQGSAAIQIQAVAGETLLAGDVIGAGGQLLMVAADATAQVSPAGQLDVTLVNRLRTALSSGASVTWSTPMAPFRLLSHTGVLYSKGVTDEVDLVLGEAI